MAAISLHANKNKLTSQGSCGSSTPEFCGVKLLFLSVKSGGFEDGATPALRG